MNKKSAYLMDTLEEGIRRHIEDADLAANGYVQVISKKDRLVKAENDFTLGLSLGYVLGKSNCEDELLENLEFKFLANRSDGFKLYELFQNDSTGSTPLTPFNY